MGNMPRLFRRWEDNQWRNGFKTLSMGQEIGSLCRSAGAQVNFGTEISYLIEVLSLK